MSRARSGLLAVLVLVSLPLASAQVPGLNPPSAPTSPPTVAAPSTILDIHEGPLTFRGPANSPTHILVMAPDGTRALEYSIDTEGRARLDVAGENALADATFLRLEGDPTGDAFALVLRDAGGGEHKVSVDRARLAQTVHIPTVPDTGVDVPEPPVAVQRPPSWPGAPQKGYLLHVRDSAGNQLGAQQLNGLSFLQKAGSHRALLQIPLAENEWDRWMLSARRVGHNATLNSTFVTSHATAGAMVLAATFTPSLLMPGEGDSISLVVTHEKRLSPLVVQRFEEPASYRYRVDGNGPIVTLSAPAESPSFKFDVRWSGGDALSGMGNFVIHYRESGAPSWSQWTTTSATGDTFSGEWGRTYELRARALDRVGNPSGEAYGATRVAMKPADQDDVNDAPTARLLTPRAGSELAGVVTITWVASDPDGTPLTSRVEVSDDDGESYRLLYVGRELATQWDTREEADGSGYRIRISVSDGTQSASDSASALSVRNVVPASAPPPPAEQPPAAPTDADPRPDAQQPAAPDAADADAQADGEGDQKSVPAPFAALAVLLAALAMRRRAGRS